MWVEVRAEDIAQQRGGLLSFPEQGSWGRSRAAGDGGFLPEEFQGVAWCKDSQGLMGLCGKEALCWPSPGHSQAPGIAPEQAVALG